MFSEIALQNCQHQILTDEVTSRLASQGIRKLRDFLNHSDKDLAALSSLKLRDILTLRQDLIGKYSSQSYSALELLNNACDGVIKTDVKQFDEIVGGGFKSGRIYELFGPPSTGKTQTSLTVSAIKTLEAGGANNVIYFDTKGDFKIRRFVQILQKRAESKKARIGIAQCLERLKVKKVLDLSEMRSSLESLECAMSRKTSEINFWSHVGLLVIDNIASLVLPLLYTEDNLRSVFGETAKVICLLRKMSFERNLCVVVVNHSTLKPIEGATVRVPSLGKIFQSAADFRILMTRERELENGAISATLKRSPSLIRSSREEEEAGNCKVNIDSSGIVSGGL